MTAVKILGREYRVRNAGDPEHAYAVADYVDRVLREARSAVPDTHDAAILAAFNIASELLRLRGQKAVERGGGVSDARVQAMIDLIDSV